MKQSKRAELLALIRGSPGLLVTDYAKILGTGNHPINQFLKNDPEGNQLAIGGFVAVYKGMPRYPEWAIDPVTGSLRANIPCREAPSTALVALAPSPITSLDAVDQLQHAADEAANVMLTTRSKAKRAKAIEVFVKNRNGAMANVAVYAELLKAKSETIEAQRQAIEALRNKR